MIDSVDLFSSLLLTALFSAIACGLILTLLLRTGLAWKLALDQPNARSLHVVPTPRCGGWGIVPVIAIAMLILASSIWPLLTGFVALALISYLDDRVCLSAGLRFAVHAAAVILVLAITGQGLPLWTLLIIAFVWIWSINLYNFMDGADGLAGSMTLIGFAAYAIAGRTNTSVALTAGAAAGAALGFLFYNRPPAKIFLGDVGSVPLGFLAAGLGYIGWKDGLWPFWFTFMAFSPFVLDATVTLLKRLLRGERVWEAHREHYYQRMVRSGLSHARMTSIWFGFMLTGGALAIILLKQAQWIQWTGIASWMVILIVAGLIIDRRWARFEQESS